MVQLLNCLQYAEIINFMRTKEFQKANLKDCLKLSIYLLQDDSKSPLMEATVDCVLENVAVIANKVVLNSKVRYI